MTSELLHKQYYRWMKLGPWYAMFPMEFALESIEHHTKRADAVLDPFMGRGTTLAAATMLGRHVAGIEINPIAWVYAQTKMQVATELYVREKLHQIANLAVNESIPELHEFYSWCFCEAVLKFLLVARRELDWRRSAVDRTLMALILVDLHGQEKHSLSNQMRQTKAMSPAYSIMWWKKMKMPARHKDPVKLLRAKIDWRYRHGAPVHATRSLALNGDSTELLPKTKVLGPYKLLLTSPPYYNLINYNYDQWIRSWMLGGPNLPVFSAGKYQSDFGDKKEYQDLLNKAFLAAAPLMTDHSRLVVRTDTRDFTLQATINALELAFPQKSIKQQHRPLIGKTQTELFGNRSNKLGEVDIVLTPRRRRSKKNDSMSLLSVDSNS